MEWLALGILVILSNPAQSFILVSESSEERGFALGTQYVYEYWTKSVLNDKRIGSETQCNAQDYDKCGRDLLLSIRTSLQVTPRWHHPKNPQEQLLQFQVSNPVYNVTKASSESVAQSGLTGTFFVHTSYGKIQQLFAPKALALGDLNFFRGIASLFQYQSSTWQGSETDVSGDCQVLYTPDHHGVHKTKQACHSKDSPAIYKDEQILDVSQDGFFRAIYKLQGDVIETCQVHENHIREITSLREVGIVLETFQHLHLKEQVDSDQSEIASAPAVQESIALLEKTQGKMHKVGIVSENALETPQPVQFKNLISSLKRSLRPEALAKELAAKAFLQLLPVIQRMDKADLVSVLKDKTLKETLPQILDVLGSAGTIDAHFAALELAGTKTELLERYFWATAQTAKPEVAVVQDILKYSETMKETTNTKLQETVMLTLGTLGRRLEGSEISGAILRHLVKAMKTCSKEPCYLQATRALKNLRSSKAIPVLLDLLHSNSAKINIEALKALKVMPPSSMNQKVKTTLLTLFKDPNNDSSARTLSVEILLSLKPGLRLFEEILGVLEAAKANEMSLYSLNRMREYAESDAYLKKLLQEHSSRLNWNLLANNGFSSTFARTLTNTPSGNATFSYGMEISQKLLKRSSFELLLRNDKEHTKILQLDIFASGLGSLMDSAGDGEGSATAGMELTVLGNSLRPFVFFESMSDLIGLYWSGQAEKKTSALQGSQLLHNHNTQVHTSNGLILKSAVQSCVSFDFSGQAKISMWDKSCQTVVENSAAIVLKSSHQVLLPWDQSSSSAMSIQHEVATRAQLNLEAEIDAGSDDPQMCIRMQVPAFPVRYSTTKRHLNGLAPSSWKPVKISKSRESRCSGKTLFLNGKNCELCNKMYPK